MSKTKFGILLWSQGGWPEMLRAAKMIDRLGYDHLWTWDHLYAIFGDPYQPIFEGWSLLNAWARETEKTQVGLLVGANTFRNPGLVAKIVATLDHVSDGRAILGIGGAWFDLEHQAHGIDFGSGFGQRLDWLDEAEIDLAIVTACGETAEQEAEDEAHDRGGGQQTPCAPGIKSHQAKGPAAFELLQQQSGNEISGENEKYVHSKEPAPPQPDMRVKSHHQQHGNAA